MVLSHTKQQQGKHQLQNTPLCFKAAVTELQPWEETPSLNPMLPTCPVILFPISESCLFHLYIALIISFLFSILGNIISSYPFCILTPCLISHSRPKEDEKKMRSESNRNFNSWHTFGQTVVPVPFSPTTTTTSQKKTFTIIQILISKRNSLAV